MTWEIRAGLGRRGEKLEPAPGQDVAAPGPDRNLSVDEVGRIRFVELATSAQQRA